MSRDLEKILNKAMPANAEAGVGTLLKELIERVNLLGSLHLKNTAIVTAPVLAIKTAAKAAVTSTAAFSALVEGSLVAKNANQDMTALAGVVAAGKSALFIFYMSQAGTLTTVKTADADTAAAALALLPAPTANLVRVGYVLVENGTEADFTGGTTALDAEGITATLYPSSAVTAFSAIAPL